MATKQKLAIKDDFAASSTCSKLSSASENFFESDKFSKKGFVRFTKKKILLIHLCVVVFVLFVRTSIHDLS